MNGKKTIRKRSIYAAFGLALFLFVHAGKCLHVHEKTVAASLKTEGVVLTEKGADCSFCDFHFARDSDAPPVIAGLNRSTLYPETFLLFKSRITSSVGLSFSDRGPPAALA